MFRREAPVDETLTMHAIVSKASFKVYNCATVMLYTGMLTLTVTNPVWVVKTRLCLPDTASVPAYMRYTGLYDGLKKLYCNEGVRGFYRGFIPGLWGTSHGAIQFMLYEEFKKAHADYRSISIDTKLVMCYIMLFYNMQVQWTMINCRALLCMLQWLPLVNC